MRDPEDLQRTLEIVLFSGIPGCLAPSVLLGTRMYEGRSFKCGREIPSFGGEGGGQRQGKDESLYSSLFLLFGTKPDT